MHSQLFKYILFFVSILNSPITAQNKETNVTFTELINLTLPTQFSAGIAYIYNNQLNIIGGRKQTSPEILVTDKKYSLDLSSLSFTNDNLNGNLIITSLWTETFIDYPFTEYMNYSIEGITIKSQLYTIVGDRLYIVAAEDYYDNNDLLIFDMKNDIFIDMNTYSEYLIYDAVEACITNNQTHIFAIGGWKMDNPSNRTQVYSIQFDRWTLGGEISQKKGCMGCSHDKYHKNIYLFGGWGPTPVLFTNIIEKYNTSTDEWTVISAKLQIAVYYPRCILDDISNDNSIWCMGGVSSGQDSVRRIVNIFDVNTETVKYNQHGLVIKDYAFSAVIYRFNNDNNGVMLVLGGYNNNLKDLDMIQYNIRKAPNNYQPTPKPTSFPTLTPVVFNKMDYNITLPATIVSGIFWIYDGVINILGGIMGNGPQNILKNTRYSFNISSIDFILDNSGSFYPVLDEQSIKNQGGFQWSQHFQSYPPDSNNKIYNYSKRGYICDGTCYTILDQYLYIFAPVEDVENRDFLKYNMITNQFVDTSLFQANAPWFGTGACVTSDGNRKIYVTGGYYSSGYRSLTQIYDVITDAWSMGSNFNQQRGYHGCAFNTDYSYLYIIAGSEKIDNFYFIRYDSIEKYDVINDKWMEIPATTQYPLWGPQCVVDRVQTGYIWCSGGYDGSDYVPTINVLNPATDEVWHFEQGMVEGVNSHHSLIYDIPVLSNQPREGLLFVFGGIDNVGNYVDIIQYMGLRQIPTTSPTSNPTTDPTNNPSLDPTMAPTKNPTIYPTTNPTKLETESIYLILDIVSDMSYGDMIKETYRETVIQAMISTILKYVTLNNDYLELFYRTILRCNDNDKTMSEWKYFVITAADSMDLLEDFATSDNGIDLIEKALQNTTENNVAILQIGFEDEYIDQCDDVIVNETNPETTENETGEAETSDNSTGFVTMSYLVLAAVIIAPFILFIVAFCVHRSAKYKGSDAPSYLSIFNYFANVGDFWSDILFAFHLNALHSSLFLFAAIFTFIPYLFGIILLIAFILTVRGSKNSYAYISIARYLYSYDFILIALSLIGGLFPSLLLCSSKLFHLNIFSLDFRSNQLQQMQIFRFFNITVFENLPQLIIQFLFGMNNNGFSDSVTIIAMFFSILSLLMGIIKTISNISESRSFAKNKQVSVRLDDWLSTDTMLGEEMDNNGAKKEHIKANPKLLFKIQIKSDDLRKHHLYTKFILTEILVNNLSIDRSAIELFAFNMMSTTRLDLFVEISLTKLIKYQLDMSDTKYSKIKSKMLAIGDSTQNNQILNEIVDKMELSTIGSKEIDIDVLYLGDMSGKSSNKATELVALESHKVIPQHIEAADSAAIDPYAIDTIDDD